MATAPTFDQKSPPNPQLIDACVHCGFCLATCPSYRVIGKETDSPRGRIYLMDAINTQEIGLAPNVVQHFDTCLGCLACVTTCPSGVQYDRLISATRAQVERNFSRSPFDFLLRWFIFHIFPYPQRMRWLLYPLWLYQKLGLPSLLRQLGVWRLLPDRLRAMESILPPVTKAAFSDRLPVLVPAQGQKRYRVGVILGCVQRLFQPQVNEATVKVLAANGCEVVIPPVQGCCGALSHHQGQEQQAQQLAREMIDCFRAANVDYVIINAAGCGHTLKEYHHLLADDPQYKDQAKEFVAKVRDIHEFLDAVGMTAELKPIGSAPLRVVYQDACHLLHGQKISLPPRRLLKQIPQLELAEIVDNAICCGSAGVYNILQPQVAEELGRQKVHNLLTPRPDVIASPNVGCALQIRKHLALQHKDVPVLHPVELLARSLGNPLS
ncbi:MAG: heterodisulfide reductase-related iron-sulfur binding cluster [Pseudanabaenaceae cyanobacterium SKYGB_i_bin29]|nr:heterodisulfide reductase-related iron-sulfur binding cluster [Pseudanabaenaceae cyanobacterium SKYG29]MDW8420670.1 heterodisulfide reductase-related iron-sulfur binding cluster [Pseudanabaenaceae cyanobacterium SKYGB_i_bin29]